MSKLKPFDYKHYVAGGKVVTRSGIKVSELHLFRSAGDLEPLIGVFENDNIIRGFKESGKYGQSIDKHEFDLFMAPIKKQGWVNLFKETRSDSDKVMASTVYDTKEQAMKSCFSTPIDTVMIEWEE